MLLEHLNPELNQEMEEQETNECMPFVAAELKSIGMAKFLELRESQKRDEKGYQLSQQYSDINQNGEDELDEYIADLAESPEPANPELGKEEKREAMQVEQEWEAKITPDHWQLPDKCYWALVCIQLILTCYKSNSVIVCVIYKLITKFDKTL